MMRFTSQDLEKKLAAGTIQGYDVKQVEKKVKREYKEAKGLTHIMAVLDRLGIPYVKEHKFHAVRRFRFDVAILFYKVAIEYEGINSNKSRHTTKTGYTRDSDKYNIAQSDGWRVLRYTALNYKQFENDLDNILKQ